MNNSAYFDVATNGSLPQQANISNQILSSADQQIACRQYKAPVTLVLQDVLFTGNVTMANWTFAISVCNKLWISKKISLYFGKTRRINRPVYMDELTITNQKLDLDVKITAYNMYGDIVKTSQTLHMYFLNGKRFYQTLVQAQHNRTCLSLKFAAIMSSKYMEKSAA